MSYMNGPRLHFTGRFQADVSTLNNSFANFDVTDPNQPPPAGPGWNGNGTGNWKLANCVVTGGSFADGRQAATSADDAAIGTAVGSLSRISAKLVDLDTEQQGVSQIFGMTLGLGSPDTPLFKGVFDPAALMDIWVRPIKVPRGDAQYAAIYQSVVSGVVWGDVSGSPLLTALKSATAAGELSVKFTVDGFEDNPTSPTFTFGRIVGTIGPVAADEPRHFVVGRQLQPIPPLDPTKSPMTLRPVNFCTALVDTARGKVIADFGNAFRTDVYGGDPVVPHNLMLGVHQADGTLAAIGAVTAGAWLHQFAGLWEGPAGRALTSAELALVAEHPLVIYQTGAAVPAILAAEGDDGLHVRADNQVVRLSPGDTTTIDLRASRFGVPLAAAQIAVGVSVTGTPTPPPPGTPAPASGAPVGLTAPTAVTTDARGRASLTLAGHDLAAEARAFIDGQVYAVGYDFSAARTGTPYSNFSDPISALVWSSHAAPTAPTWWTDIFPIFRQYADLYPFMRQVIDLSNYTQVVASKTPIARVFGLPETDPHFMPVTRDLSPAKRAMIVGWLSAATPPLGVPPAHAAAHALSAKLGDHGKHEFFERLAHPPL